ncbi:hypothetical protein H4281_14870 [Amycolatopsis sp. DR6-1]|uniref:PQQ-like domain-containing protein n=1 Tax=Amycolatopsis dendrobii TaxID=2760662 RepID=A0A7W3ZB15_9PSEU|nr:hypothetical protein [Amycolatopsis dendrobii]
MPGQIWGVAAPGPDGPLVATSYDGDELSRTVLTALDLSGAVVWQHRADGHPYPPLVSANDTVWIARRDARGCVLTELDLTGRVVRSVALEHEPHEHLGAFVLLANGFCGSWLPADPFRVVPPDHLPRVARHDEHGRTLWSATIPVGSLKPADTGPPETRPNVPPEPRTLAAAHWQPLLISADRVAAGFADDGSGIGVTFFLDLADGTVLARTPPGPRCRCAIAAPGEFLIGEQGYGIFRTTRYDRAGTAVQQWPSHALLLIDRNGGIRGPESENIRRLRSRFRGLAEDGTLFGGPLLRDYYTTYPALDRNGTAVFWREGQLIAVDTDFYLRVLFASEDERAVMSRVLLLADGQVVFSLGSDLLIFRDTGLGPLDDGPWPCDGGGLNGNPVRYQ